MLILVFYLLFLFQCGRNMMADEKIGKIPVVINTWASSFSNGTAAAWDVLSNDGTSALDAIEVGCTQCEILRCDTTVGFGGSPDENGETTLDAMIMDGVTHNVGAVGALRRVKNAISVARKILHHTNHTLLVGDQATSFALTMGFKEENLSTPESIEMWKNWKTNKCQPNFWMNVSPNPKECCGPYKPLAGTLNFSTFNNTYKYGPKNHDTIGMVAIDKNGNIAAGTSSNGAKHKIPGRVGDSPIPGAGAYADGAIGGAAATGDGDVMMRFLPTYNTVENMRHGMHPEKAAQDSIMRIAQKYPSFMGGIVAVSMSGEFGAACHGLKEFPYSVVNKALGKVTVKKVQCIH